MQLKEVFEPSCFSNGAWKCLVNNYIGIVEIDVKLRL
jgi:hypothetical protein